MLQIMYMYAKKIKYMYISHDLPSIKPWRWGATREP